MDLEPLASLQLDDEQDGWFLIAAKFLLPCKIPGTKLHRKTPDWAGATSFIQAECPSLMEVPGWVIVFRFPLGERVRGRR